MYDACATFSCTDRDADRGHDQKRREASDDPATTRAASPTRGLKFDKAPLWVRWVVDVFEEVEVVV
jgi:hypothetical protein